MSLKTMLRIANTFDLTVEELLQGIKRRKGSGFGSHGYYRNLPQKTTEISSACRSPRDLGRHLLLGGPAANVALASLPSHLRRIFVLPECNKLCVPHVIGSGPL